MTLTKAKIADAKKIKRLVDAYAAKEQMLPRSLHDIYENIRDYYVARQNGNVIGCCALHIVWEDLAEVRSLAVDTKHHHKGLGRALVKKCLSEAKLLGLKRAFCLTYVPLFFSKCGFHEIDKSELPHKVWGDCLHCSKFPDCNEVPMIIDLK